MAKVSIIVPIYNVEQYLRRSIESIQNQTLEDIEIILVNDGSLDNSLLICKEFAKEDKRIKVIDQPNWGVSSARNRGLEVATGEYIGFVDPDDWIESKMYENMYKKISETKSDICMSDYVIDNTKKIRPIILDIKMEILNRSEITNQIMPDMISPPDLNSGGQAIMGNVWRLLISKRLLDANNFRFAEDINIMEDLIFCTQVFLKAEQIVLEGGKYYHYMTNPNSAVRKYREDYSEIQKAVIGKIEDILIREKVYEILKQRLNIRYVHTYMSLISNEANKNNNKKMIEKIKEIKNICKDTKFKKILKDTDTTSYTLRKKMTLYAMKNELSFYLYLYYTFITRVYSV